MVEKRIDIISDTHGVLTQALLDELQGADAIVHAGDITSNTDLGRLETIAPVYAVKGNNDYFYDYPKSVARFRRFSIDGVRFAVTHYEEELPMDGTADVEVCGHTHRPKLQTTPYGGIVMNPGSSSNPRSTMGPTIGRLWIRDGRVEDPEIIQLPVGDEFTRRWWMR